MSGARGRQARLQAFRPRVASAVLGLAATMMTFAVDAADTIKISASNFMFSPTSLTVSAGATVTWTNMDDEPHTVVSDTGLFRSGAMDSNESFSFEFDKPGTYHYTCSIHPRMVGTIVVQ
jgi:plastocyanin